MIDQAARPIYTAIGDSTVQGRVTLKSTGAISMADIYSTLETALAASGSVAAELGQALATLVPS